MNTLEKIARFVLECSFNNLSERAVNSVKRAFLDTTGVAIAGIKEEPSKIVTEIIEENLSKPSCSVLGADFKTNAVDAALANGTILHSLDYDDTGAFTQGHPSAPIYPVILAIAEENNNNNGREIIEAYTIGVEIQSRLSQGMPMLHLKGWHPTSVFGTIAAAAVACKLLKLNLCETKNALGIAGSMSSGLVKNFGTMTKPLHIGKAAGNGILAAKLAKKGFSASAELFDYNASFQESFWGENSEQFEDSIKNIGKPLRIDSPGINIKRYPSCSLTHRAVDATLDLIVQNKIETQEVDSIDCFVPPRAVKVLFYTKPKNKLEAKFSVQFVLASAIFFGELKLSHFTDEIVKHPEIVKLMTKISLFIHDDWQEGDDQRADKVVIKLSNGKLLSREVAIPKGNVKNPMSDIELKKKFEECTKLLATESQIKIFDKIHKLEELKSINEIIDLISFK